MASKLLSSRDRFLRRQFSHGLRMGDMVSGWFKCINLSWTLLLLFLHQLHLRLLVIRPWRFRTPDLGFSLDTEKRQVKTSFNYFTSCYITLVGATLEDFGKELACLKICLFSSCDQTWFLVMQSYSWASYRWP